MGLLEWLELSALGEWVATSVWGYPIMLSCHAIGLAVVAGSLAMADLRVAGCFNGLEIAPFKSVIKLAWAGFIVNLGSGIALFSAQATHFIGHPAFLIKIICITLVIIDSVLLYRLLEEHADDWDSGCAVSATGRFYAVSSLLLLSGAMISGRMIAYIE